jgi:hypothetical protein
VNLLLHLLNSNLVFLFLWRTTRALWPSALVAALFAVHPLHVESVAWVAERKDLLSTLFWLLAMDAYSRYVRSPGVGRYLPVVLFFVLGLMCKPMPVTLPFVLLLLDFWPLERADAPGLRLVREKLPLFLLSAASCFVTWLAQADAIPARGAVPFGMRISNALVSYATYLEKTAWPSSLAVFYPHPATLHAGIPAWRIAGSVALLCGISFLALRHAKRHPYLPFGWLWYLGTLVPVIGLVQAGSAAMADRYTYVPLLGIFIAIAWGMADLGRDARLRRVVPAICGCAVLLLAVAAWKQAGHWRNSATLYGHAVEVTKDNWLALYGLGLDRDEAGQPGKALEYYESALRIKPDDTDILNSLGVAYGKLGMFRRAYPYFREALRIRPDDPEAWKNMGMAFSLEGRYREAVPCFREAMRIRPDFPEARENLEIALRAGGGS